jgi:hypothetical protein
MLFSNGLNLSGENMTVKIIGLSLELMLLVLSVKITQFDSYLTTSTVLVI